MPGRPEALVTGAVALLFSPLAGNAAIHEVPGDFPTIREALGVSAAGDTVLVAPGTYAEHDLDLAGGVTLLGDPLDPRAVVIDGQRAGRIAGTFGGGAAATVRGVTFRAGAARAAPDGDSGWGGGLLQRSGTPLVIEDCVFESCSAARGGGAHVAGANSAVRRCRFFGCRSEGQGGGLRVGGLATMEDCIFRGNEALAGGGAYADAWPLAGTVLRCLFDSNSATGSGGGASARSVDFLECEFRGNHAEGDGGGLYTATYGDPAISDCLFEGNSAGGLGGGTFGGWHYDGRFLRNRAARGGGVSGALRLERCDFRENEASAEGGAASFSGRDAVAVVASTFVENSAPVGGGVSGDNRALTLITSTFVANRSDPDGGSAVFVSGLLKTIQLCILAFAPRGIPVAAGPLTSLSVLCTDVYGNADGDWVGPIAIREGLYGNLSADPMFCAPFRDLGLSSASPCLPENHPDGPVCQRIGAMDAACSAPSAPLTLSRSSWGRIKSRYR